MKSVAIITLFLFGSIVSAAPLADGAKTERRGVNAHADGYDYDFYYVLPAVDGEKNEKRNGKLAKRANMKLVTRKEDAHTDGYDYDFYYVLPAVDSEKTEKRSEKLEARKEDSHADGYDYDFYYVLPVVEKEKKDD